MAVNATRRTTITLSGDVIATVNANAADNAASPGKVDIVSLALGVNTITPPSGGATPVACTILPPAGNVQTMTLKGVAGDTGVALHKTDPAVISLNSPTTTFVLDVTGAITGVRLVWT
jgi:hypothetical protein